MLNRKNVILCKLILLAFFIIVCGGCSKKKEKNSRENVSTIESTQIITETNETEAKNDENIETDNKNLIFADKYLNVSKVFAKVSKYYVYGTHFNFEAKVNNKDLSEVLDGFDGKKGIKKVSLCLVDVDECLNDEKAFADLNVLRSAVKKSVKGECKIKGKNLKFKLAKKINEGLFLEDMEIGDYALFLNIIDRSRKEIYIPLSNATKEKNIEYYTITDLETKTNNRIDIFSDKEVKKKRSINFLFLSCESSTLPDDVYDIVIDPGHGGDDVGAVHKNYYEKDLTLEIATSVYEKLVKKGYKVLITRDGTESNEDYTVYSSYDKNGRVILACKSKAKYAISIHLNSGNPDSEIGGVQVYCSGHASTRMGRVLAENIVNEADSYYSVIGAYSRAPGVYSHVFGNLEMAEMRGIAAQYGFKPYDVKYNDDYLYMIRELGGMITNAYTDGRHPLYGTNKYIDSNQGVECCLCELAYMSSKKDFKHFLKHKKDYVRGVVKGITESIDSDR